MVTSSDDDLPLVQRKGAFLLGKSKPIVDSSDGDSPVPSWLENHKSPDAKGVPIDLRSDSDSGLKEVISPAKLIFPRQQQQPPPANEGAASQPTGSQPAQRPAPRSAAKPKHPAAAAAPEAGPSVSQPKPAAASARKAIPSGIPAPSSSMPIVFPDKLSQIKMLVELESRDEVHGATDLSGDSGAIGRLVVTGGAGSQQMQIDLKGVLYNATIVPCPVSLAVVNVGATEAKVECLLSEFVQLREDATFAEACGAATFGGLLGDDDDDECYGVGEEEEGGAGASGKGKAKGAAGARKGAGRGGGAKKGGAARKSAGVKKPGKPRAKAKAKAGGNAGRGGKG